MENELLFVLIGLISVLGLLLVVFVMLYLQSLKSVSALRNDLDILKKDKIDLEKGTYEPVNTQARVIIDTANKKAAEIITSVQGLSEQEKNVLTNSFQQMLAANLRDYQSVASKFSQTYEGFVANIGQDVKMRLDAGLNKVIADAQTEMKKSTLSVNAAIQNLYKGYESEVSEYKKGILSQIDKLGVDIIKQVSLKVLGKSLSKKEQEDLVIKSLEEAKKLGFFN